MNHCRFCFRLISEDRQVCPRCNRDVTSGEVVVVNVPESPGEGGQVRKGSRVQSVVGWVQRGVVVCLAVMTCAVLAGILIDQNRAAQASWYVRAQLDGWRYDRQVVLQKALAELELLYGELGERVQQERAGTLGAAQWRQDWRVRLNGVRMAYQLTGQARFGEMNVRAEEALHNLVLYLTSYERETESPESEKGLAAREESLLRCFKEARRAVQE